MEANLKAEVSNMEGDVHIQLGLKMGQLEAVGEAPLADLSDMVLLPRSALFIVLLGIRDVYIAWHIALGLVVVTHCHQLHLLKC